MSIVKIFGHPLSPPSKIATSVAKYLKVPFEYVFVDIMKGKQFDEEYKKLNPHTKVPTYQEGDFILSESCAIAKYLCDRVDEGQSLYPRDVRLRAVIDMHIGILTDLRIHQLNLDVFHVIMPMMK